MTQSEQLDQDLLREAARALRQAPGAGAGGDESMHRTLLRLLQQWAVEIEHGTLRPAARATAVLLAKNIVRESTG